MDLIGKVGMNRRTRQDEVEIRIRERVGGIDRRQRYRSRLRVGPLDRVDHAVVRAVARNHQHRGGERRVDHVLGGQHVVEAKSSGFSGNGTVRVVVDRNRNQAGCAHRLAGIDAGICDIEVDATYQ